MNYKRIVLNEPHASVEGLYDNQLSFWNIDEHFINDIVLKWTDWHTDYLFHGHRSGNIRTVRFPYSRFIVDAERLWNDPLEQHGQGIVYKQFEGYSRIVPKENEKQLLGLWHWHQRRLSESLCEDALLLDCHSFPSGISDVDICIGFNEDWSKPDKDIIDMAVNLYESMMLEVNKKAYMEDGSLHLKTNRAYKRSVHELMIFLLTHLSK